MCDKMTNTRFDYYTKQEMLQVRDFIIEFSLEPYKTARLKSSCVCPPPHFKKYFHTIEINYSRLMMPLVLSCGILLRPRIEHSTVLGLGLYLHL